MTASKAEASRTALVTFVLAAAVGVNLVGEKYPARNLLSEFGLHFIDDLVERPNVKAGAVINDDDSIAVGDTVVITPALVQTRE
jgi:hypothetical protein